MKHDFAGGKYTVVFNEATGDMHAERYGDRWRSLTGDGMVLSMLQSTDAERSLLDRACAWLELLARLGVVSDHHRGNVVKLVEEIKNHFAEEANQALI